MGGFHQEASRRTYFPYQCWYRWVLFRSIYEKLMRVDSDKISGKKRRSSFSSRLFGSISARPSTPLKRVGTESLFAGPANTQARAATPVQEVVQEGEEVVTKPRRNTFQSLIGSLPSASMGSIVVAKYKAQREVPAPQDAPAPVTCPQMDEIRTQLETMPATEQVSFLLKLLEDQYKENARLSKGNKSLSVPSLNKSDAALSRRPRSPFQKSPRPLSKLPQITPSSKSEVDITSVSPIPELEVSKDEPVQVVEVSKDEPVQVVGVSKDEPVQVAPERSVLMDVPAPLNTPKRVLRVRNNGQLPSPGNVRKLAIRFTVGDEMTRSGSQSLSQISRRGDSKLSMISSFGTVSSLSRPLPPQESSFLELRKENQLLQEERTALKLTLIRAQELIAKEEAGQANALLKQHENILSLVVAKDLVRQRTKLFEALCTRP